MTNDWAYLNGRFLPAEELKIAPNDGGFLLGVTVAEQLRTFGGQLFKLETHLQRLQRSLEIVGIAPPVSIEQLSAAAQDLASHNHAILDPADDLGLTIFVTPGTYGTYLAAGESAVPQVGMHTTPLPFHLWWDKYEQGDALALTEVQQVPLKCWPAELKVRSRVHYYLADKQARNQFPNARAVMLDEGGFVTESSTANILVVNREGQLISPPRESILPGVSVATVEEIAHTKGLPFLHRPILPCDLEAAAEILLCSTSPCVWPVLRYEGKTVGSGSPGPIFRQLIAGWNELVGLDIPGQALRYARR